MATTGKAVSATVLGSLLFEAGVGCRREPLVRRNVGTMAASDPILVSYRKAIKKMMALPDTNPHSWAFQGALHWTTITPVLPVWDKCEHWTDFFWSWHRMYLYWFERIVRRIADDDDWAIPYWDWAPGSDFHLPAPFRDTTSELYTVNRDPLMNNGAGALNSVAVDVTGSFALANFFNTNLNIQAPHGSVHVETGGWMSSVPTAAQDPIFYVHHSNVDRLWDLWLAQGGARSDPVTDATWTGKVYTFFNEHGKEVNMTACEILRAAEQLHYKYEGEPPQVLNYCQGQQKHAGRKFEEEVLLQAPGPPVELGGERVSVPIDIKEIAKRIAAVAESRTDMLLLQLDDVEAERQPGVVWGVFVGLPEGGEATAGIAAHVGSLSMFGAAIRSEAGHGRAFQPARFVFPLNRAVQAALKESSEKLTITFVPQGIVVNGRATRPEVKATVKIGKMSLVIEKAK